MLRVSVSELLKWGVDGSVCNGISNIEKEYERSDRNLKLYQRPD